MRWRTEDVSQIFVINNILNHFYHRNNGSATVGITGRLTFSVLVWDMVVMILGHGWMYFFKWHLQWGCVTEIGWRESRGDAGDRKGRRRGRFVLEPVITKRKNKGSWKRWGEWKRMQPIIRESKTISKILIFI